MSLEHLLLCPFRGYLSTTVSESERVISQIHEIRSVGFSHMLLLVRPIRFASCSSQMLFTTQGDPKSRLRVLSTFPWIPNFYLECEQSGLDRMGGDQESRSSPSPFLLTFEQSPNYHRVLPLERMITSYRSKQFSKIGIQCIKTLCKASFFSSLTKN